MKSDFRFLSLAEKESRIDSRMSAQVTEVSQLGRMDLVKQVIEAKEEPLKLRRKQARWEEGWRKGAGE